MKKKQSEEMDKRSIVREGDIKKPVAANRCDVSCQMRFKERTEEWENRFRSIV